MAKNLIFSKVSRHGYLSFWTTWIYWSTWHRWNSWKGVWLVTVWDSCLRIGWSLLEGGLLSVYLLMAKKNRKQKAHLKKASEIGLDQRELFGWIDVIVVIHWTNATIRWQSDFLYNGTHFVCHPTKHFPNSITFCFLISHCWQAHNIYF